jgi:poly-gamma-glutamate synthase PgsB/CapB
MTPFLVLLAMMLGWLVYLAAERLLLERHRDAIPLRIAITGTRGKTTVTRRLANVLAKDGRRVLAKTTGSEASYLFPDGTVHEIHRLGSPSIIEQKRLMKRGARLKVDVVLAEVMSLHPENHKVEVGLILRPHMVLVTNFRVDHVEAHGRTRGAVASVLALDVPAGCRAMVPEEELEDRFKELVTRGGGEVVPVPKGTHPFQEKGLHPDEESGFGPNLDLVWAAARDLGVGDETIRKGLGQVQDDVGFLKAWRYTPGSTSESWLLVNAFAANDPESTLTILDRVTRREGLGPERCVGLLSLRADRGDRSAQWADALAEGALSVFREVYVAGLHAPAVRHRLRRHPHGGRVKVLRNGPPEALLEEVLRSPGPEGLLFGFGNIHGLGRMMVRHWQKVGTPYGV